MCVLICSTNFAQNIFQYKRIKRDIVIHVYCSHVVFPLFFSDFNVT
jgi:hypothetical protein